MKFKLLTLFTSLLSANIVNADIAAGTDTAPWKAYATFGVFHTSGIVVVDATQSGCMQRFQDAIDYHVANNGDPFDSIQHCHYNPAGVYIRFEDKLVSDMKALDETYSIEEYQIRKAQLFKESEVVRSEDAPRR